MSAGLRLTIDLDRLAGNWSRLAALAAPAECAAVVKANAYGIGIEQAVPALAKAGCKTFFVAVPEEGNRVRAVAKDAAIYVLNGFFSDAAGLYREHGLRPVLGNSDELSAWKSWCKSETAALHVDTGMNRLGLSIDQAGAMDEADLRAAGIVLLLSHPACADEPDHPLNAVQLKRFLTLAGRMAGLPCSLANSAGIHHGQAWHFAMVRPGIALYGGASHPDAVSDPVVTADARILQVRTVAKGESVGYGAVQTMQRDSRIAIVSAGYADGYLRAAGSNDNSNGASLAIGGHMAPLAGRISMDLIAADVTDIPDEALENNRWAELFGDTVDINQVAACAGTIAYELLTGLSRRAERIYVGNGVSA
jgi:alanine racemase